MENSTIKDKDNLKSQTLTMRLLKADIPINEALTSKHGYVSRETLKGVLYTYQSNSSEPTWSKFISEYTNSSDLNLASQHCSAILFIQFPYGQEKKERTMILTFGYAHNVIDTSKIERNFGLKVTLSAVSRTELVSIDTATLDSTVFQKRIQASKKSNLSSFGMNIERDLLRLAAGVPSDKSFASALAGKDALTITSKTSSDDILNKCHKALELFYSNNYKSDFDFIDHITPVHDDQKNSLDSHLLDEIKKMIAGHHSDLHLMIPEITNPEKSYEISYYGYGFNKGTKRTFPSVNIEDYINLLKESDFISKNTIDDIKKNQHISVFYSGERSQVVKMKIYDSFIFEFEITDSIIKEKGTDINPPNLQSGLYVLFSGNWYFIDKNYYNEIEGFYLNHLAKSSFKHSTTMSNERQLISELNNHPDLLNLDQVKINPTGASNANIEPCDFLSKNMAFIHLKDGESSGPISHLWNQGLVSAETYLSDQKFRTDLNSSIQKRQREFKKIGFNNLLPRANAKPNTSRITIIFGIMRTPYMKTQKAGLPFFSKVSFRPVAQTIERMGYTVELHLIEKI